MSSYLLTEIALEMLGYKFYDIDGNFGQTNFQHTGIGSRNANKDIATESLENILGLAHTGAESTTGHANVDNMKNIPEVIDNLVVPNEIEPLLLDTESLLATGISRTWPSALKKLLDLEYERIRNQMEQTVLRNKAAYVEANSDSNQIGQKSEIVAQELLQKFILLEKLKLQKESQTMSDFRKLVEKKTCKMSSDIFNKYKRAFDGSQKGNHI